MVSIRSSLPKTCKEPDCTEIVKAHGMCRRHYNRWLSVRPDGTPCSAENCSSPAVTIGLCQKHYSKYSYDRRKLNLCSVDGCLRALWAKGVCHKHWQEKRETEVTLTDAEQVEQVFKSTENEPTKATAVKRKFLADVHYLEDETMKSVLIEELPEVLTSGQVAKACAVAPRTVSKWIDNNMLSGYRIPGSKDRRVSKSDLLSFMKHHNIPLNVSAKKSVVIYCQNRDLVSVLFDIVASELPINTLFVDNPFSAGTIIQSSKPHVIFMDINKLDASVLPMLKALVDGPSEVIVAANELCVDAATVAALKVEVMKKPYRIADALAKIATLL